MKDAQDQGVQAGDRIPTIDGRPAEEALAGVESIQSGAAAQWIRWRALGELTYCDPASRQMRLEKEPFNSPGVRRAVQFNCRAGDGDRSEPRPDVVAELKPGILYVDLDRIPLPQWNAPLPRLQQASGIVFDCRGYPRMWPPVFIQHLTESRVEDVNPFTLPGGFRVVWTGLRVHKQDWSRFHGVGVRPNIFQSRTRRGIAECRDEILLRGIEAVERP